MKYEREKKGATSLFLLWSIWWYYGDQKNNISHLYHPYQLSSKILAPNLWRESKICSKLKFFGPNPNHYQPALKPPPRFPQDKDRNQKHMKKIVWDCDHYPIILFFYSLSPSPLLFLIESITIFTFVSRSVFSIPLFYALKNGGSVLIKPISDNTLFSNRSPIKTLSHTRYWL